VKLRRGRVPRSADSSGERVLRSAASSAPSSPVVVDDIDAGTWARSRLAGRVIAPGDPATAYALVLAGLLGDQQARVTAGVADGQVVGLVASATVEGRRRLLAVGVAPAHRGHGLATELVRRHVATAVGAGAGWEASVTLAERDPFEPLPRATRSAIATKLLEAAGFRVERAGGPIGAADPGAIVARRA
jgi:ribosomal protein S18 acetylase RimI-like enzyme